MKRKIKLYVAWGFAVLMVFAGCSKEGINLNDDSLLPSTIINEYTTNNLEYSKTISLKDDFEQNTLIIKVSSDCKEIVEMYNENNFHFFTFNKDEMLSCDSIHTTIKELTGNLNVFDGTEKILTRIEILNSSVRNENIGTGIEIAPVYIENVKSEQYWDIYSQPGANKKNAKICDVHWWYDVHFGLEYKENNTNIWTVLVPEWTKVPNGSCNTFTENVVYQWLLHIKARKSTAFTYSFY